MQLVPGKAASLYHDTEGIPGAWVAAPGCGGVREPAQFSIAGSQTWRVGLLSRIKKSWHFFL